LKALSILLLIWLLEVYAFGQASQMTSIAALRQESELASVYSHADVKRIMKTAHTAEDFRQLASYFDRQAGIYAAKQEAETKELYRLLALPYHARSYPAQVEGTRTRIERFKALSHEYSEQAAGYRAQSIAEGRSVATFAPPDN